MYNQGLLNINKIIENCIKYHSTRVTVKKNQAKSSLTFDLGIYILLN